MSMLKSLNMYQKVILIILISMSLIFAVIYPQTLSRVGYRYNDVILVPSQETGSTLYSGKIQGKQACFTVSDQSVVFQYGDKTYGPYTVKKNPTAIPKEHENNRSMVGIEILDKETVIFRGGALDYGDSYWLISEDGNYNSMMGFSFVGGDGVERDENGNPIDGMKPSATIIYELVNNPKLTHKGEPLGWFGGAFICILNAISILFADSLFRWHLSFRIRNAESAEPSDWEMGGRYIGWTAMTIMAMILFILGLK